MEKSADSALFKNLLDALKLTPSKFCKETTISPPIVSGILSGKRTITSDVIVRTLRRYTNVNIEYLLGNSELMFVNGFPPVNPAEAMAKELAAAKIEIMRLKAELYDLMSAQNKKAPPGGEA